nr:uncharacterized protein LOC100183613 isoform X1 [Ciona intestinalis]XP_026693893.1 uncharacterized protein LOC100183613 isoform X1 [Ciona intestinalis]|eukprot:XP_018670814.1 uncharacterized protein LOC100183613 isoform X1 [Ciona intestinalis]
MPPMMFPPSNPGPGPELGDEHIPYDILNNNGPMLVFIFLVLVMMCCLLFCWCVAKCYILAALDESTVQNYINYKRLGRSVIWADDVTDSDVTSPAVRENSHKILPSVKNKVMFTQV